ncbi:MAG: response regulator [Prolixibacteraceae bacterium]
MKFQKKILVIEDDQFLGITIQNILSLYHYDVCYANNGATGIQKAFTYNPDLIICDIHMDPVDGYQVYKVLEESSLLNRIPFVFLTGSSELKDIRFGLSLGADDYLVKPFQNSELINTIEKRIHKYSAIKEIANKEFVRLFDLSPNGILLFDENKVFNANPALLKFLKLDEISVSDLQIQHLFDSSSVKKLIKMMQVPFIDRNEIFNDNVTLRSGNEDIAMRLIVSEFEKFSKFTVFIGVLSPAKDSAVSEKSSGYALEVQNLLKRENIKISETLGTEITNIFKQKQSNQKLENNSFFTRRENQVLYLAMEGLPIKLIADRLSISDRTVEKYRTSLMEKTGANNMIEVIVFALKNSLIEL